jgi:hypothetical protein
MVPPDYLFLNRRRSGDVVDEALHVPAQIEASVEAVGEGSQVDLCDLIANLIVDTARTKPMPERAIKGGHAEAHF